MEKKPIFQGKNIEFFFRKQKESISWNELMLTLKKREIELEKHFSNRSKHLKYLNTLNAKKQKKNSLVAFDTTY